MKICPTKHINIIDSHVKMSFLEQKYLQSGSKMMLVLTGTFLFKVIFFYLS